MPSMLKGKINSFEAYSFEAYTLMFPYAAFWPTVYELHYEPTPEEFGQEPKLYSVRGGFGQYIIPARIPKDAIRSTVDVGGAPRELPLKSIIDLERRTFGAFGPDFYDKNPSTGIDMLYLIIERNGERLAEYLGVQPLRSGGIGPHNITLTERLLEPKRIDCGDVNAAITALCDRPVRDIHRERRPYEFCGFTEQGDLVLSTCCWQPVKNVLRGAPLYLVDAAPDSEGRPTAKQTLSFTAPHPDAKPIGKFLSVSGVVLRFAVDARAFPMATPRVDHRARACTFDWEAGREYTIGSTLYLARLNNAFVFTTKAHPSSKMVGTVSRAPSADNASLEYLPNGQ